MWHSTEMLAGALVQGLTDAGVEVGKDVTLDDLKKNYDATVFAVGLTEPNSVRAEGENKRGVLYGLPFLRDIGMGTSKVKLGPRVAVIGGGNTAIDCAREALRQGAVEVTMITVEANQQEMPAVPEDLHDMLEEGVELMHGMAMTAVLGDGKVEALQLHPARFTGKINASPIAIDRDTPAKRFPVDNVIIAVGQHAKLDWLPAEYKTERGTIKIDEFGRIARLRQRFGDDEGDAVADRPHLAAAKDRPQRPKALRPAHVFRHDRHQTAELVGRNVGAREHGNRGSG
jgi:NADPH-dependent glutamate synthase beta subunit-like oxidoreductase